MRLHNLARQDRVISEDRETRVVRSGASSPTEIGSELFGQNVVFLSPNNTDILAHQGSTVTLSCRVDKNINFGMVSTFINTYYDVVYILYILLGNGYNSFLNVP